VLGLAEEDSEIEYARARAIFSIAPARARHY
jgi:hypothetical protein